MPDPSTKYTDHARFALDLAVEKAKERGSAHVDTLHLLWALFEIRPEISEYLIKKTYFEKDFVMGRLMLDNPIEAAKRIKQEIEQRITGTGIRTDYAPESAEFRYDSWHAANGMTMKRKAPAIGIEDMLFGLAVSPGEAKAFLQKHYCATPDSIIAAIKTRIEVRKEIAKPFPANQPGILSLQ